MISSKIIGAKNRCIGIGGEETVFKTYVDTLVNGKLAAYKHRPQYGSRQGESLFTHLINGIFVLERLRPLVGLSEEETRVLFSAYIVHDLNKLPLAEGQEVSFNALTSMENVGMALAEVGIEEFFPDYADSCPTSGIGAAAVRGRDGDGDVADL